MARPNTDQTTIKNLKSQYPYVYAWGRVLRSGEYYIADQLVLAHGDNAPKNALYKRADDAWATTEGMNPDIVETLHLYVDKKDRIVDGKVP